MYHCVEIMHTSHLAVSLFQCLRERPRDGRHIRKRRVKTTHHQWRSSTDCLLPVEELGSMVLCFCASQPVLHRPGRLEQLEKSGVVLRFETAHFCDIQMVFSSRAIADSAAADYDPSCRCDSCNGLRPGTVTSPECQIENDSGSVDWN